MIDYRLLEAFAAVLDEGGFERAADRLGLTQSAVSQRIRALEDGLGRILVLRESPPRASPAGERLLRHYRQVAGLEEEAISDLGLGGTGDFRHLPIAVNADSLSVWLLEAVAPFLRKERISLELFVDDQDRNTRFLRSGTVAGCLSSQRLDLPGFGHVRIGALAYVLVASKAFHRQWFPGGFDRDSASRAPIIHFNRDDQLQYRALAQAFGKPQVSPPAHYIPSPEKLAEAIGLGLGYGMLPQLQAAPDIARGRLVELDPRGRLETTLYWYRWSRPSEILESFSEVLVSEGRRILAAQGQS